MSGAVWCFAATGLGACDAGAPTLPAETPERSSRAEEAPADAAAPPPTEAMARRHSPAELDTFDFDGDGVLDAIDVAFSGGGHCCYTLTITPSKIGKTFALPFQLDGGYVGGLSLAQPRVFNITDYDHDGIAEVCAQIETYNGKPNPLPAAWRKRYGFRTHWIEIRFATGKLVVRDHGATSCEPITR